MSLNLGRRIAPPRFILFAMLFAGGLVLAIPRLGWGRGGMAAFDVAAAVFLVAISALLKRGEADKMREASEANDANRAGLLVLTGVTMIVVLVSIAKELQAKSDMLAVALVVLTLVLAWLFSNVVYALHYAHLYYANDENGEDRRGLDFPECEEPDYWDFLYFAFTLGMTFQTSDVEIRSRRVRRVVLGHSLAAFVFNIGVIAFTINTVGSMMGGK